MSQQTDSKQAAGMSCAAILNIGDLYAEKRLTPARMLRVAQHVEDCAACSLTLQALVPIMKPVKAEQAPAAFKQDLAKLLAGKLAAPPEPAQPWLRWPRAEEFPAFAGAAAYASLLLLLAAAGPGYPSQGGVRSDYLEGRLR